MKGSIDMARILGVLAAGIWGLFAIAPAAYAVVLDVSTQCSAGNASNGIAIGNVTGNLGGATDCWGTFDKNDPGPSGEGFVIDNPKNLSIDGLVFDFVAKENTPGVLEGVDIGLKVTPSGGATSGNWAYDPTLFSADKFLIVLKAASKPGYAVWLFDGADAASSSGTWSVPWSAGKSPNPADLSHLSVYAVPPASVPEPSTLGLMGLGLLGLGFARHRRK